MLAAKRTLSSASRSTKAALCVAALALAAGLSAPFAVAQPSSNDKAAAEALFDEGKKLLDAKSYAEACRAFEASQKLDAGVGTLLFLGDCYERIDRIASAWATFREAAAMAKTAGDSKREQIARGRVDALEPKLFRLTIAVVEPVAGLTVKRNGVVVPDASWGIGVPVDPGQQKIEVSAPGYLTFTREIEVPKEAGKASVAVPKLAPDPGAAPPAATATGAPTATAAPTSTAPPPTTPPPSRDPGLLTGGFVLGGLGVAAFAVTGALLGVATQKYKEGEASCDGTVCSDPLAVESADEARTLGDAATATLVLGAVLTASGVSFIVVHFVTEPEPSSGVVMGLAPHGDGGLAVWGRF
jgi:serine/threonine-protein kinase